ncbi:regulatory protein RecX [Agitococcus lubricus]|uniref:Regulatory protein RecX n=1 Tax=Agitococcus lubricus TaxID=1077255 RepID=A0A2T5IW70_9GAMM|nr:regulatory protein RecX [Agitococcus lubricus]PTQ88152.1 regulatory protein [Agitococcus lubricus]
MSTSELSHATLRSKALAMLTRREHSRYELQQKLLELGASPEQVTTILQELVQQSWQSDERFCELLVRSYVHKGHGEISIRQELKRRGILTADIINTQLANYDWYALAQQVRSKKFGLALPTERQEQAKQCRFLQYRGFNSEQIWYALKHSSDIDSV